MNKLSVVIITKNEEKNLGRCLESVKWADELIVVDTQSTDETLKIADEYGARIYSPVWRGYGPAKRHGVDHASGDWILSLDADEALSDELVDQIRFILQSDSAADGYYMRRKTRFLGRWIKHCGWYPDYVLRLFKKESGNFNEAEIHERVVINGSTLHLHGEILHYSYPDLEHYFEKSSRYTTIGARQAFESGRKSGLFALVIKPPVSFISHYFVKRGFLDGLEGFIVSLLSAFAVFVKYAKLNDLYRQDRESKKE